MITQDFSKKEFACKCKCGADYIDERLVHRLQVVRDILGVKIDILSGCRCQDHNLSVGGKPESLHLSGQAADWTTEKLIEANKLLKNWSGGFHFYKDKGFIHTDIGRKRRW